MPIRLVAVKFFREILSSVSPTAAAGSFDGQRIPRIEGELRAGRQFFHLAVGPGERMGSDHSSRFYIGDEPAGGTGVAALLLNGIPNTAAISWPSFSSGCRSIPRSTFHVVPSR